MLFWKTKENPWADAGKARKNPPIFITFILCFAIFWGYMYLSYFLRDLLFSGISAFLGSLIESGKIANSEYAIYDDMNVIAYSLTFILLVPIAVLYMKFIEGRSIKTALAGGRSTAEDDEHSGNDSAKFLAGFAIGAAILALILGFLSFFNIYSIKGAGDFHWLSFVLGFISIGLMSIGIEYFFRGLVLSSFGAKNHPLAAIFASALLYAVCMYFYFNNVREFNFFLILDHLMLGILLGVLVCRTKSIWTAVGVRFALVIFSQLILGIPFSGYTYVHSMFASKYSTISIWFTTELVSGVDTGFGMFAALVIALCIALFIPVKKKKDEEKRYFKHVEEAPAKQAPSEPVETAKAKTEKPAVSAKPEPAKTVEDDDEDWEEETTRDVAKPNYKAPEEYLKK